MNKFVNLEAVPRTKQSVGRLELRFYLRMIVAGLMAFATAEIINVPLHGLWVVLTAVVVIQMSIGGSLHATIEYIIRTLGGAVYGGVVGVLIPHTNAIALACVFAVTIAPLALVTAINSSFRVAPFSAVLVLVIAGSFGKDSMTSALYRLSEVILGSAVAVAVSLLVFPERAQRLGLKAAAGGLSVLHCVEATRLVKLGSEFILASIVGYCALSNARSPSQSL